MIWNNLISSSEAIVEKARLYLQDWRIANTVLSHADHNTPNYIMNWQKPQAGWKKLNVDAALDSNQCVMGFGWVVRDEKGEFVAAKCQPEYGHFQPKEAEAMAIREALSWMKTHNMRVHIETDSLLVVQGLNSMEKVSYFDLLLLDIKDACSHFVDVSISFVKRSANRIAHLLAWESLSLSDSSEWFSSPPPFICNALLLDRY